MTETHSLPDNADALARNRRRWLLAAVAGAAALGGMGVAWLNETTQNAPVSPADDFWRQEFVRPTGGMLRMSALRGRPLILNFWATWCPPCIEELPLLSDFHQENSGNGWQVLGLAIDRVDSVERFLAHSPVSFPVAMAGVPGIDMTRSLGNLMGGLPFTVVFDADGVVVHRKMGRISAGDLRSWVAGA
jgi:thiol-disulfide isomerase/thioredoxin